MIKQKLLATTALVSLVAGSAFAGGPAPSMHNDMSVKIGGMYDAQLLARSLKNKGVTQLSTNNENKAIDTKAQVFIEAKNSTAKGLEYGAHIGLSTNTSNNKNPNSGIDRSWLWMEHADMGRVEFGSNNDVSESMRIGADRVATATGGISGDWFKILNSSVFTAAAGGASFTEFHLSPWSVGDNELDLVSLGTNTHNEKARKINYYSPKMNGFQAGVSYTADTAHTGATAGLPNTEVGATNAAGAYNVVSAGLTWEGKMTNDIMTSLSAVTMHGKVRNAAVSATAQSRNISAFDLGGMISYNKMKAAVSYGHTAKTGFLKATTGVALKDSWYATAGASYEFDKFVTSLTYMHGNKNKNKSDVVSLGADYHLASGIMPYAEITHFKGKLTNTGGHATKVTSATSGILAVSAAAETNNKASGTAFIIGTKLSF
jgi:predicted porin